MRCTFLRPHVPVFIHIDGTRWKHKPDTQMVFALSPCAAFSLCIIIHVGINKYMCVCTCACVYGRICIEEGDSETVNENRDSSDKNVLTISWFLCAWCLCVERHEEAKRFMRSVCNRICNAQNDPGPIATFSDSLFTSLPLSLSRFSFGFFRSACGWLKKYALKWHT